MLEVTEGHRLTLTYNLFCVRGNGQLGGNCPWLDPVKLPLYQTIKTLVQDSAAWGKGEAKSVTAIIAELSKTG